MTPSLLLGIIIGGAFVFLVLLAVVTISGNKATRSAKSATALNQRATALLKERNNIGERQMFAINEMVYGKQARRERIAVALAVGLLQQRQEVGDYSADSEKTVKEGDGGIVYKGDSMSAHGSDSDMLSADAIEMADALIAELDKPETETTP